MNKLIFEEGYVEEVSDAVWEATAKQARQVSALARLLCEVLAHDDVIEDDDGWYAFGGECSLRRLPEMETLRARIEAAIAASGVQYRPPPGLRH